MPETIVKTNRNAADFIDALFIAVDRTVHPEIQKMIGDETFTWLIADFDTITEAEIDAAKIGTVIIDAESVINLHQQRLLEIIALLDRANIPTVLFGNTNGIDTDHFKMLNVIEKTSAGQIIPVIKISNVYRNRFAGLANHNPANLAKDHAQQLEIQLKMAGSVQKDFLPRTLPDSDKFKWAVTFMPADWVSGDIYDIARIDEKHIGFYLADAVGHSMPAALLTMFLKQAVQMRQTIGNEYKIFTPLEVISNLNQKMVAQHLHGCQFVTCCYCLLNTETLTLEYCRAGHPYPILIGKDSNLLQLQTRGSLLGVFEDAQFEQGLVQLRPGDKLLLYSDGAEPFMGAEHNGTSLNFTKEFMSITALPAKQLTTEFEKLTGASKDTTERDDISLITLEII